MSVVVHFSSDLSAWLVERLNAGATPGHLAETMIRERMEPRVACAIVDAFVEARKGARLVPIDSLVLEEGAPPYVYESPTLRAGARIETFDRTIRVVARAEKPVLAVLADVLSADECSALIDLARPRLSPSTVVDPSTGHDVMREHRSSMGMFFRIGENPLLERSIAASPRR